jgi:hypothetical protein
VFVTHGKKTTWRNNKNENFIRKRKFFLLGMSKGVNLWQITYCIYYFTKHISAHQNNAWIFELSRGAVSLYNLLVFEDYSIGFKSRFILQKMHFIHTNLLSNCYTLKLNELFKGKACIITPFNLSVCGNGSNQAYKKIFEYQSTF